MNRVLVIVLVWITITGSFAIASPVSLSTHADSAAEFNQAVAYFNSSQYQKALNLFNVLAATDSDSAFNYYRGVCLYQLGDYGRSLSLLGAVDSSDSLYALSCFYRGVIMEAVGDPAQAVKYLEVTGGRDSTFVPARIEMINTLCKLQRFDEAERFVSERFDVSCGIALCQDLIDAQKYNSAIPFLTRLLKTDSTNAAANLMLANVCFQTGKYAYAEKRYSYILQTIGPSPFVIKRLALCYGKMGGEDNYKTAISLMSRYLAITTHALPNDFGNIGLWHYNLGEFDLALVYFGDEVKLDTFDPEARLNLGLALMQLGQAREAIKEMQKAYGLSKTTVLFNLSILESIAAAKMKLKEYSGAVDIYRRAHLMDPEDGESIYGLGLAYDKWHHYMDAIYWYRQYLEMKQDNSTFADYAKRRIDELSAKK